MRAFKVKAFARWARKERISDVILRCALSEMKRGLIDAELGGGICKKRVSASSRGKRGGGRTIVAFRDGRHIFFLFGYLKNERSDIDQREVRALKKYAACLFALSEKEIEKLIIQNELIEIL